MARHINYKLMAAAKELIESGKRNVEVAKELGISPATVSYWKNSRHWIAPEFTRKEAEPETNVGEWIAGLKEGIWDEAVYR